MTPNETKSESIPSEILGEVSSSSSWGCVLEFFSRRETEEGKEGSQKKYTLGGGNHSEKRAFLSGEEASTPTMSNRYIFLDICEIIPKVPIYINESPHETKSFGPST